MIDIKRLLRDHNVEFVEAGSNVAKGNININCPWCGADDPSHHLGINLDSGLWGCWRNAKHRGRKLSKLLVKLLGVGPAEARRLAGEGSPIAMQQGDYDRALSGLTEGPTSTVNRERKRKCSFDTYMHRLTGRKRGEGRAVNYLVNDRGFKANEVRRLARRYDLHFAINGEFADRIVIPVYEDGELQTYLGRSIYAKADLRYRALEEERSVKQVKECVYNFDLANKPGKVLYIVEGTFDVFKIDFYNYKDGVRAVGLFNMIAEPEQLELLYRLRNLYKRYVILLDKGEVSAGLSLKSLLRGTLKNLEVQQLKEAKDPGDLTARQSVELFGIK